jgi:hypothetical protein
VVQERSAKEGYGVGNKDKDVTIAGIGIPSSCSTIKEGLKFFYLTSKQRQWNALFGN